MANVHILTIDGLDKLIDELIKVLENFSYEDHGHEISDITGLLDALNDKISSIEKGAANGVASLGEDGKVPQNQLSGFVTDEEKERWNANEVVKGAFGSSGFTTEDGQLIPYGSAEDHKFYIDTFSFGLYFGYNGNFESVSKGIQLGETSTTAFRGDRGKIAYEHSKSAHAPANADANVQADWNESSTTSDAYIKNKPTSLPANGGNADTTDKLYKARTIDGINFDGTANVNHYYKCMTSASTKNKVVSISNFQLEVGAIVIVNFVYGISINDATLNVSNTGAKAIRYKDKNLVAGAITSDSFVELIYNGSTWNVVGELLHSGSASDYFGCYDFNDYIIPGNYVCHVSPGVTWENAPQGFITSWLDVYVTEGVMTQRLTEYEGGHIYIRGYYNKWSAWKKITLN